MAADPDEVWLESARRGDSRAMEQLYRRNAPAVHGYALRATGRRDAAEEITQETFIRAFRGLSSFDGRSTFRTWLLAIAINRTRTAARRSAGKVTVGLDEAVASVEAPSSSAWTRQRLGEALQKLPEGYREVVIMHDVLEMEHQEIAAARGCSLGTSKSQLHKARAKLREMLTPLLGGSDA